MSRQHTTFRAIRRELAEGCSDPLDIAALALEQNERLQQRIRELEEQLGPVHL